MQYLKGYEFLKRSATFFSSRRKYCFSKPLDCQNSLICILFPSNFFFLHFCLSCKLVFLSNIMKLKNMYSFIRVLLDIQCNKHVFFSLKVMCMQKCFDLLFTLFQNRTIIYQLVRQSTNNYVIQLHDKRAAVFFLAFLYREKGYRGGLKKQVKLRTTQERKKYSRAQSLVLLVAFKAKKARSN